MITDDDMFIEQVYGELILEKTIRYSIPKDDKQTLMFDFYMLSFLEGVKAGTGDVGTKNVGGRDIKTATNRMGLSEDIEDSFEAAKEKLLPYLKEHMLQAVFFAVCAELRHVDRYSNARFRDTYKEMPKIWKKMFRTYWNRYKEIVHDQEFLGRDRGIRRDRYIKGDAKSVSYKDSYKAALYALKKTDEAPATFMKMAQYFFEDAPLWDDSYGGDAWARITKGWLKLASANTPQELYVYIDHVYDLQHNTGKYGGIAMYIYDEGNNVLLSNTALGKNISSTIKSIIDKFLKEVLISQQI